MEGGINNDDLGHNVENDEISNGVETTDLADERILYPNSISNSNEIVRLMCKFLVPSGSFYALKSCTCEHAGSEWSKFQVVGSKVQVFKLKNLSFGTYDLEL